MKLTPKQKAFADYYIQCGNASEAARKAGYSPKTAFRIGQENMQKPAIQKYIDEKMQQKDNERIASQDEVLEFLTKVLRGEEIEEVPVSTAKEIRMIEKTPSIKDRTKAAELLGKRYAIFTEKLEHSGDIEITTVVKWVDDDGN